MKLYDKALVTVDQMGNELTRDRIREFCSLTCKEVFICYIAPEHIIAGEVGHSLAVGEHGGDAEVTRSTSMPSRNMSTSSPPRGWRCTAGSSLPPSTTAGT